MTRPDLTYKLTSPGSQEVFKTTVIWNKSETAGRLHVGSLLGLAACFHRKFDELILKRYICLWKTQTAKKQQMHLNK